MGNNNEARFPFCTPGLWFPSEARSLVLCRFGGMFPDEKTPDMLIDGVRFADLPILHVKISKNNTVMSLTDAKGRLERRRKGKRVGGMRTWAGSP